jgi:cardiolipin synthase A/B
LILIVILSLYFFALIAAIHAIMGSRTSQGSIAWSLSLLTLPMIALPLYLIFGRYRFEGYVRMRSAKIAKVKSDFKKTYKFLDNNYIDHVILNLHNIFISNVAEAKFTTKNKIEFLQNGQEYFPSVFAEIEKAQNYILLQSYIIQSDQVGQELINHLISSANRGVKVYILYDSLSSHIGHKYIANMEKAGIKIRLFNPGKLWRAPFQINFRNHRKLVIIDGQVAYIGGMNFADEYNGLKLPLSPWLDAQVKIEGPAVSQSQISFYEDWYWVEEESLSLNWHAKDFETTNSSVLVTGTGPSEQQYKCELLFMELIRNAKDRLWISSPYFVPGPNIISLLKLAKMRGVDVQIFLPGISDFRIVKWASQSYIKELLEVGIKVYEFNGFLHQKIILVDDIMTYLGSANFDYRSFRLNFEILCFFIDKSFALKIEKMFKKLTLASKELNFENLNNVNFFIELRSQVARLFSPIL